MHTFQRGALPGTEGGSKKTRQPRNAGIKKCSGPTEEKTLSGGFGKRCKETIITAGELWEERAQQQNKKNRGIGLRTTVRSDVTGPECTDEAKKEEEEEGGDEDKWICTQLQPGL